MLGAVNPIPLRCLTRSEFPGGRIPQLTSRFRSRCYLIALALILSCAIAAEAKEADTADREAFTAAWKAAGRGDRAAFEQGLRGLQGYLLYPYLQYEDFRHRRSQVEPAVMAAFLADHEDWAFSSGLRTAWLRSLGKKRRWEALLAHAGDSGDVEVQCYYTHARIRAGDTEDLLPVAQALWTVGKSQPDPCDPVFDWLRQQGGVTPGLAWERIRLAMEARQPRLTRYLARYLPEAERLWADRWYEQDRGGYRHLGQAARWPDLPETRDIADFGLRRLARSDPDRSWRTFQALEGRFAWPADVRERILREIAL